MRFVALLSLGVLFGGMFGGRVDGGVVTQSQNFSDSQSSSGSGVIVHAGPSGLSANFNPFDSSLGTLDSFTIAWTTTVVAGGTTDASTGGSLQLSIGGAYYVNQTSYDGNGGGDGTGGPANTILSPRTVTVSKANTFLASDAGVTYNPVLLAALTGNVPFALKYANTSSDTVEVTYTTMSSINSSMTGSVTLTYNYTGAPVPEPASMWIGASLLSGVVGMRRFRKRA